MSVTASTTEGTDISYEWYKFIPQEGNNEYFDAEHLDGEYGNTLTIQKEEDVETYFCEVSDGFAEKNIYFSLEKKECDHHFVKETVPSTCTKQGQEITYCDVCGKVSEEKALPLLAHQGQWVTASNATVFAPAKQTKRCTTCGRVDTRLVGSKLKAKVTPNASSLKLKTKQSTKKFKVTLAKGDYVVSWKTSNKKIVTVSGKSKGTCTIKAGKKTGTAKITIKTKAGATKTIKVKVQKSKVSTSSIKNVPKKITIKKGKTYKLSPSIRPITSTDKAKYKTSN